MSVMRIKAADADCRYSNNPLVADIEESNFNRLRAEVKIDLLKDRTGLQDMRF